jgi:hypothetical protein
MAIGPRLADEDNQSNYSSVHSRIIPDYKWEPWQSVVPVFIQIQIKRYNTASASNGCAAFCKIVFSCTEPPFNLFKIQIQHLVFLFRLC